jgi:hypothetical protein
MRFPVPLLALVLLLAPTSAKAAFHLWDIVEVYSNADGSVQYIEFFTNMSPEEFLSGHVLSSNAHDFIFPNDLPTGTANHHFLIATPGFASLCDPPVSPDYTFDAANFHSLVADTIDFAGVDTFVYTSGQLPTDGFNALHEDFGSGTINRRVEANSPTNFAGQTCLPEPSGWLMRIAGLAGVLTLDRGRRRTVH